MGPASLAGALSIAFVFAFCLRFNTLPIFVLPFAGDGSDQLVQFVDAFMEFRQLGCHVFMDLAEFGLESLAEFAELRFGFFVNFEQLSLCLLAKLPEGMLDSLVQGAHFRFDPAT